MLRVGTEGDTPLDDELLEDEPPLELLEELEEDAEGQQYQLCPHAVPAQGEQFGVGPLTHSYKAVPEGQL